MYHAVNVGAVEVQNFLDHGSIGAGGGEHELSCVHACSLNLVVKAVRAAVDQLVGHGVVEALGIFLCQILGKHVVACARQSVAAHSAVVAVLVGSLSE